MTSFRIRRTTILKQKLGLVASQLLLRKRSETLYGILRKGRRSRKLRSVAES